MLYPNNKRYNTLDGYFKTRFGCKVAKISLNAGFSCPNRDGTKSFGGCIYCSPSGSGDFAGDPKRSIREQFEQQTGLQTVFDDTGKRINRRTTYAEFLDCYARLCEKNIPVCVHLINGLPGEDRERMLESVRRVSALRPHSVKLHMLHILKDTPCAEMYARGEIKVFEKEEYIELVCDELELLHPDIIVQRITGDGSRDTLIAPLWSIKKFDVLNGVDRLLSLRNTHQGTYGEYCRPCGERLPRLRRALP